MLIVIYIMIYQHSVSTVLVSVSSVVVAGTFAFGNSVKTLFESILFLFATHPFDIGDNVIIEETVYTVVKFDLLSSVLRTAEKSTVYMSNAELAAKEITNLRRSPDMIDWLILEVDAFTSQRSLVRRFQLTQ
jgi:small-conductance mechanosensitive channel